MPISRNLPTNCMVKFLSQELYFYSVLAFLSQEKKKKQ